MTETAYKPQLYIYNHIFPKKQMGVETIPFFLYPIKHNCN